MEVYLKKHTHIGRGLCFDSIYMFPLQGLPRDTLRYVTREVEIKAVLVSQEQQTGFAAVLDLSECNKIGTLRYICFVHEWVGGFVLECRGSVLGYGNHHVYNDF